MPNIPRYNRIDSIMGYIARGYITLVTEETLLKGIADLPPKMTPPQVIHFLLDVAYITADDI